MTNPENNTYSINNNCNNNSNNNFATEIIDDKQFDEVRELFEEDFAGLLQTYIEDSKQRISVMQTALLSNDNAECFESSHALRGASATIGATQLVALSGQLESACRAHKVGEQSKLINQLSSALQEVEREITKRLGQ